MKVFKLTLVAALLSVFTLGNTQAQSIHQILKDFDAAVKKYTQLEYDFESKERRRNGSYITTLGHFKVWEKSSSCRLIAANLTAPDNAKLRNTCENQNKMSAKLGKLPYVGLDVNSKRFQEKSHQPPNMGGFKLPLATIKKIYNTRKAEIDGAVEMKGSITFNGKECTHIVINDTKHGTTSYTVKAGENLTTIAHKLAINQMQILELNPGVKNYTSVKAGQTIKIPNSFGTKITIYLEKARSLPLYFKIEDSKGLLSEYQHKNLNTNPGFTQADFAK